MKRKGAAFQSPRALDSVRARRQSGTAASGNVFGRGIKTLRGGQGEVALGDGLQFDAHGNIVPATPHAPLVLAPGSPVALALDMDETLHTNAKGKLAVKTSSSVRSRASDGALEAVLTTDQVLDPSTQEAAQVALARKVNTGDARLPIARGVATLVGGTVDVAMADVAAGAIIVVNHGAFAGTPGLLSASATASTKITITSASILDTSTVFYAVWNP
jgi:hypothetical protein